MMISRAKLMQLLWKKSEELENPRTQLFVEFAGNLLEATYLPPVGDVRQEIIALLDEYLARVDG